MVKINGIGITILKIDLDLVMVKLLCLPFFEKGDFPDITLR